MLPNTHLNPADFPDSPIAHELTRGIADLRFAPTLEAEYLFAHLQRARLRIRIWTLLSLVIALGFAAQGQSQGPLFTETSVLWAGCIALIWAGLAAIAFSPRYEQIYIPVARVAAPLVSALIAWVIAQDVAAGEEEDLVLMAIQLFAVYFFLGLLIRPAAAAGLTIIASFALGTAVSAVPVEHAVKATVFLCIAGGVAAVVCRDKERAYRKSFLEQALIAELLETDALTGLKNRRAFDEHLRRTWQQAQRDGRTIGILMLDVDHFKRYNDTNGHQAGDQALRRVAREIREFARRPLDVAARYGGEEFSLILFDLAPEFVADVAERLRRGISELGLPHSSNEASQFLTVSVGAAIVEPAIGRTAAGAVQLADEALYEAKAAGRNRVVIKGREDYGLARTGAFKRLPLSRGSP
jgi:diguanylate cyclase (GGDEF)-like protein